MTSNTTPQLAVGALKLCYQEYAAAYLHVEANKSVRDIMGGIFGGTTKSKVDQTRQYEEYLPRFRACADDLYAALKDCPPEDADTWIKQALEYILFYPVDKKDVVRNVLFVALEELAIPLFPLMTKDALNELINRYQKHVPRLSMFPKQKEVLKAMKAAL